MSQPELRSNEAAQAEAQARLAAIIESSDDAIVSKTLEGVIVTWNSGAERIFGYTSAEVVGKPITIIIPEDRLHEETMILQRLRNGERVDHFETIRRRKDGRLVEVSVTISPVRDATGRIMGVSKIARDITPQKQFERELSAAVKVAEDAKEAAEAANRSKDHFLSVLSHELRTPLTPVLGAISYIENDETLPASVREQMSMIRRNVETEARLVDDLLDLTRIAREKVSLRFEVVDAHAVIRNVVAMFEDGIDDKALSVTVALRAKDHHVWADPGRFQQVLLNLMSNAVKFTPREGSIAWRSSNANSALKIEITDTGVGFETEMLPRLFKPFEQGEQTVTRRFGGLGLGLSIVKSLVEMHNGTVAASSAGPGKGSTFSVSFATIPAVQQQPSAGSAEIGKRKPLRILLVEDHLDTRQVMSVLLSSFGCIVSVAGTVKEAVALADREQFDLLVSDIGLPDGTGLEVMRRVSERQHVKAIAISGFGQEDDLRRSREAGFVMHLTKPVNLKMLREAISSLGAG